MTPLEITLTAVLATALIGALGALLRVLGELRTDVALIRAQLMPAGEPSLRETVSGHSAQIAVLDALVLTKGHRS